MSINPVSRLAMPTMAALILLPATATGCGGADPERANLQQVSESVIEPGDEHSIPIDLTANALHLVVLEPAE